MKQDLFFPLGMLLPFSRAQVLVAGCLLNPLDVFFPADRLHQFDSGAPVLAFDPRYPRCDVEHVRRTLASEVAYCLQRFSGTNMSIFQDQFKVHLKHLSAFSCDIKEIHAELVPVDPPFVIEL